VNVPPSLQWVPRFARSVESAVGSGIRWELAKTVNPLVYTVRIGFNEQMSGKNVMHIWNLFQMFAASNDCVMKGKKMDAGWNLIAEVGMKERLGHPKKKHPLQG
jgi:hypothetical protein